MNWSEKQRRYQLWSAMPRSLRPDDIKTVKEFAKAIAVSPETLGIWECTVGWWDEIYLNVKAIVGRSLNDICSAMVFKAKLGNVPAAKLCLSMLNLHNDQAEANRDLLADQLVIILNANVSASKPGLPAPLVIDMPVQEKVVEEVITIEHPQEGTDA